MVKEIKVCSFDEFSTEEKKRIIDANMKTVLKSVVRYVFRIWRDDMTNLRNFQQFDFCWSLIDSYESDDPDHVFTILGVDLMLNMEDFPEWMYLSLADSFRNMRMLGDVINPETKSPVLIKLREYALNVKYGSSLVTYIRKFIEACVDEVNDWVMKMRFDSDYRLSYLTGCEKEKFMEIPAMFRDGLFTEDGRCVSFEAYENL